MSTEQNPFIGMTDVGEAEQTFNQFRLEHSDDRDTQRQVLLDLLDVLLGSEETLTGDSDDFHNFAVTISKVINDNKNAYAIIQRGLTIHPIDTDLLADALLYGYNSGTREECKNHYQVLTTVDKAFWTWRAFSFSITYLLDVYKSEGDLLVSIEDILRLSEEYERRLPTREDPWLSRSRIYERINQHQESIKVLEEAISKFRFCPKCWLRYADIMLDQGDYEKAEPIVRKMLKNPKSIEYINTSYMHYLDGLCKFYKLMDSEDYENGNVDEVVVLKIYRAFKLSKSSQGLRESVNQRINEYIERLTIETGIEYD